MSSSPPAITHFRHEALLYSGWADFVAGAVPFIRDGVERRQPVLVVESLAKINLLRSALGDAAEHVAFADMAEVGANPARIIPAWQDFVTRHAEAPLLRGIGEPIWPERDADELVECQRHEALLNAAFDTGRPWWLLCPYDTANLAPDVIQEVRRSHEFVSQSGSTEVSAEFRSGDLLRPPLDGPFPEPNQVIVTVSFDRSTLTTLREQLLGVATSCGLSRRRRADFVAGVNEVATNSVVHGGGAGVARIWRDANRVVCEVRDAGRLHEPLADRRRPAASASAPRGLWLANQLCDLVQMRSGPEGTVVRLQMVVDQPVRLRIAPSPLE